MSAHCSKTRPVRPRRSGAGSRTLGTTGLLVPPEYDGAGMTMVEAGIVLEELGAGLHPGPWLSSAVAATRALVRFGVGQRHGGPAVQRDRGRLDYGHGGPARRGSPDRGRTRRRHCAAGRDRRCLGMPPPLT